MCLGIPMQIKSINGFTANCEAKGVHREVSLFMLQDEDFRVDDYVVVHVGYAIQRISPQEARAGCAIQKITPGEARTAWELYDQMLAGEPDTGEGHA